MKRISLLVFLFSLLALSYGCKSEPSAPEKGTQEESEAKQDEGADLIPLDEPDLAAPTMRINEPRVVPSGEMGDVKLAEPVPPPAERKIEPEEEKAQRLIRQLTNYLMAAAAKEAPADLEAAKAALIKSNVEWPDDPWGTPYVYQNQGGRQFEVFSVGPDGEENTDDDIHVTE